MKLPDIIITFYQSLRRELPPLKEGQTIHKYRSQHIFDKICSYSVQIWPHFLFELSHELNSLSRTE